MTRVAGLIGSAVLLVPGHPSDTMTLIVVICRFLFLLCMFYTPVVIYQVMYSRIPTIWFQHTEVLTMLVASARLARHFQLRQRYKGASAVELYFHQRPR